MKTWITSLTGAIVLAFVHLLLELWRGFLDFAYVLPDYSNGKTGNMTLYGLLYTVIFAIWLIGLRNAGQGKRSGLITAILLGLLFWLGLDLSTLFFLLLGRLRRSGFRLFDLYILGCGYSCLIRPVRESSTEKRLVQGYCVSNIPLLG